MRPHPPCHCYKKLIFNHSHYKYDDVVLTHTSWTYKGAEFHGQTHFLKNFSLGQAHLKQAYPNTKYIFLYTVLYKFLKNFEITMFYDSKDISSLKNLAQDRFPQPIWPYWHGEPAYKPMVLMLMYAQKHSNTYLYK